MSTAALSLMHSSFNFEHYYLLLSQTLNDLEQRFERSRAELHHIFDQLVEAGLMEPQLEPNTIIFQEQATRRYRYHPLTRPTPASSSSRIPFLHPSLNVEMQHPSRPLDGSLSSCQLNDELGTKGNPIYVSEYKGILCEGCNDMMEQQFPRCIPHERAD